MSENGTNGIERIAAAFAQTGKRAALMPYLMGGYPTLADSIGIGEACVEAGADIIELGMPYSDPLADGPVIHAAGTQALQAGANVAGVLEVARALAQSVPVVLMCYANMVFAPGARGVRGAPREDRRERADRARPAARRGAGGGGGMRGARAGAGAVGGAHDHAGAAWRRSGRARRASCTRSRSWARPASAASWASASRRLWSGRRRARAAPVALGFGISTPEHALQAAQAGADGVIVGTRLVRAAGEASDPAGAVGAVVGELAAGLAPAR